MSRHNCTVKDCCWYSVRAEEHCSAPTYEAMQGGTCPLLREVEPEPRAKREDDDAPDAGKEHA